MEIIFDGPPSNIAPRFIEVNDSEGKSINVGKWEERKDGMWALVIKDPLVPASAEKVFREFIWPLNDNVAEYLKNHVEKTGNWEEGLIAAIVTYSQMLTESYEMTGHMLGEIEKLRQDLTNFRSTKH